MRMSSPVDIQVLLTTQGDLAASQAVANEQEAHHQELADEFLLVSGSGNTSSTGSERVSLYAPLCCAVTPQPPPALWRWRSHRPSCVSGQMPCPGELCSQQCFPCITYAHLLITNQGLLVSPLQPGCRVLTSFHASVQAGRSTQQQALSGDTTQEYIMWGASPKGSEAVRSLTGTEPSGSHTCSFRTETSDASSSTGQVAVPSAAAGPSFDRQGSLVLRCRLQSEVLAAAAANAHMPNVL